MPTPFMHLHTAEQILSTMKMSNGNGRILSQLEGCWPAFYMGSVAPDVNAISDLKRSATHFYKMPPDPELQAYAEMLVMYPDLACVPQLPTDKAVFVAAYSAHLLLDLVWLREIVYPYFMQDDQWGTPEQRRLTHFILLTYLDTLALEALPDTAVTTLANAHPHHWVPFISDDILIELSSITHSLSFKPLSFICFGIKYLFAISSFSSTVYPLNSIISILSLRAG